MINIWVWALHNGKGWWWWVRACDISFKFRDQLHLFHDIRVVETWNMKALRVWTRFEVGASFTWGYIFFHTFILFIFIKWIFSIVSQRKYWSLIACGLAQVFFSTYYHGRQPPWSQLKIAFYVWLRDTNQWTCLQFRNTFTP